MTLTQPRTRTALPSIAVSRYGEKELDAFAEALERDGICVIEGLIPEAKVARWKQAFDDLFELRRQLPNGLAPGVPRATT